MVRDALEIVQKDHTLRTYITGLSLTKDIKRRLKCLEVVKISFLETTRLVSKRCFRTAPKRARNAYN